MAPTLKTVLLMVAFGTLLLGNMMGENAIGDWGQEYMRHELDASTSFAGMAVSIFVGAITFGRLFGDKLPARFGNARVFCGCGIVCVAGMLITISGRKDPENAGRNIGLGAVMFLPLIMLGLLAVLGPILMSVSRQHTATPPAQG